MQSLPENPQELKNICISLYRENEWLKHDVNHLESLLRRSTHARFAATSESMTHSGMQCLFPEVAESQEAETLEDKKVVIKSHERKTTRKPFPESLPRQEILIDVENKHCESCGGDDLKKVSEQVSEKLHYKPAEMIVHKYIRPIYSCRRCETMKFAHLPLHPIAKCSVTTETIAQIAVSKYVDALPLYRQEQIFARSKVEVGRDKMARWLIRVSEKLEPITTHMRKKITASDLMQMDETVVQVLKEQGRLPTSKSYMIVQARGSPTGDSIVLFHYNPSRSKKVMEDLVIGFRGILLTDGLGVYDSLCTGNDQVIHAGCWSHARRKFVDAQKALKPSRRKESIAGEFLILVDELFTLERQAKDLSKKDHLALRLTKSAEVVAKIEKLLNHNILNFPKTSETGKALHYLSNQWDKLIKFLKDSRIPLHNNFTENMIRPFTVGRKNWLFSDSSEGAKASAIIYSLLVTAQVNGLNPYDYLCKALKGVSGASPNYDDLLPFSAVQNTSA